MSRLVTLAALVAFSVPVAAQSSLVVSNESSSAVFYLYASPCSASGWGEDRLGSDTISSGDSYSFAVTPGCWDLKARFADGDEATRRNQQVRRGAALTWTLSDSGSSAGASSPATFAAVGRTSRQGTFVVANRTDQALFYLYASPCRENEWGADQLGSGTVSSGSQTSFSIDASCWDLKARFRDGQETVRRNQQVQSGGTLTWTITSN